jgi:hypothetical protein
MDRVKRIHGYISKMKHGIVRIRTEEPDHSDIPEIPMTGNIHVTEEPKKIDSTAPRPWVRELSSTYVDANLFHDLISGKSVTGTLHWANQTVIDFSTKLQSTVETATFGSEYVAARTSSEQIIDLRCTFRYLGYLLPTLLLCLVTTNQLSTPLPCLSPNSTRDKCIVLPQDKVYRCKHSTVYSYS